MRDPQVLELKARISLVADADLTRGVPPLPRRQAVVEVTATDGRKIQKRVRYNAREISSPHPDYLSRKNYARSMLLLDGCKNVAYSMAFLFIALG